MHLLPHALGFQSFVLNIHLYQYMSNASNFSISTASLGLLQQTVWLCFLFCANVTTYLNLPS